MSLPPLGERTNKHKQTSSRSREHSARVVVVNLLLAVRRFICTMYSVLYKILLCASPVVCAIDCVQINDEARVQLVIVYMYM